MHLQASVVETAMVSAAKRTWKNCMIEDLDSSIVKMYLLVINS